jgi:hypothetical protein
MTNPHRKFKPMSQVICELLDYDVSAFLADDNAIHACSDYLVELLEVQKAVDDAIAKVRYRFMTQLNHAADDSLT